MPIETSTLKQLRTHQVTYLNTIQHNNYPLHAKDMHKILATNAQPFVNNMNQTPTTSTLNHQSHYTKITRSDQDIITHQFHNKQLASA